MMSAVRAGVVLDIESTELTAEDRELLAHPLVVGVILFTRNYQSRRQLKALSDSMKAIKPELMIMVDQEGGRVQRFVDDFTDLKAMSTFGLHYQSDPKHAITALQTQLNIMVDELYAVGVDMTLMPVLDMDTGISEIIGERSFGSLSDVVIALGQTVIQTLHARQMLVTAKHFPGHGGVAADSHVQLPVDERDLQTLLERDMLPFMRLKDQFDFVMPAHIVFSKIDDRPVGFSPVWIQEILRKRIGYRGRVITDDLSMAGAASFGDYVARVRAALDAGCDLLLVCNDRDGAVQVLETAEKRVSTCN